jgi:hypothetical protein
MGVLEIVLAFQWYLWLQDTLTGLGSNPNTVNTSEKLTLLHIFNCVDIVKKWFRNFFYKITKSFFLA